MFYIPSQYKITDKIIRNYSLKSTNDFIQKLIEKNEKNEKNKYKNLIDFNKIHEVPGHYQYNNKIIFVPFCIFCSISSFVYYFLIKK